MDSPTPTQEKCISFLHVSIKYVYKGVIIKNNDALGLDIDSI